MANIIFKTIKRTAYLNGTQKSLRERLEIIFVKNHRNAIKIRTFNSILKLTTLILYIIQVVIRDSTVMRGQTSNCTSSTTNKEDINWQNLLFFEYEPTVRFFQFSLAMYGLVELTIYFYVNYNGKLLSKLLRAYFIIEFMCDILWLFEMVIPEAKNLYIPAFLNCWIIKRNLEFIFKHYNNMSAKNSDSVIGQHLVNLAGLFVCLVFTSTCGYEYFQRGSQNCGVSLFDSLYHTIITMSTVGYGDIAPTNWLSKLFVAIMIIVSIIVIPVKIEYLVTLWLEKKKTGGSYTPQRSHDKHIVLCLAELEYDFILHFLKEFYGHKRNQATHTILLSNTEISQQVKQILNSPLWNGRVYYINGSALRDSDLERAQVHKAKGVFIVTPRGCVDKDLEDQHTILRSWAIKDFAPNVPQFVQLFRTENKVHLEFVDNLVCEDEFKYAILANNCICPGISTVLTLLMHRAAHEEKYNHLKDWQQLYGKLAGNEMHAICISKSQFFSEFIGKRFSVAAYIAHKKYNVLLLAVASTTRTKTTSFDSSKIDLNLTDSKETDGCYISEGQKIFLNPGPHYELNEDDICIYVSIVKEQDYDWSSARDVTNEESVQGIREDPILKGPNLAAQYIDTKVDAIKRIRTRTFSVSSSGDNSAHLNNATDEPKNDYDHHIEINDSLVTIEKPPNPLFYGCFRTQCKLLKTLSEICCLELNGYCKHRSNQYIQYKWKHKCIIIAAESACNGLLNFIAPLRGKFRPTERIRPIVLLLKNKPSIEFLESICSFPLIYWCQGTISNITSLLQAGILNCSALVVVSTENHNELEDESLYDSSNIFAIDNVTRFFPSVKIITELRKASNIRFMKFRAKFMEREKYMQTSYMYKPAFASGSVFSASMMDTLLYQAYGKPYLIKLIKLLVGLKQIEGSGNLNAILITSSDMWIKTYGNLFKKLACTTGEIPIGIYRTIDLDTKDKQVPNSKDYQQLVIEKMKKLKIDLNRCEPCVLHNNSLSYVLINPPQDFELSCDDIVYILQPNQIGYSSPNKPIIKCPVNQETV